MCQKKFACWLIGMYEIQCVWQLGFLFFLSFTLKSEEATFWCKGGSILWNNIQRFVSISINRLRGKLALIWSWLPPADITAALLTQIFERSTLYRLSLKTVIRKSPRNLCCKYMTNTAHLKRNNFIFTLGPKLHSLQCETDLMSLLA